MKICITSQGDQLDSQMDLRFGRAAYFILVDSESMKYEVIENQANFSAGGAGIAAASQVIDIGAEVVLTGNCGPKAFEVLQAANVQVYTDLSGMVGRAVIDFQNGVMTPDTKASVDAHNGLGQRG